MSQTTQAASLASPVQDSQAASGSIAPAWHTVLMVLLVLGPLIQAVTVERSHPGVPLRSPAAIPLYLIGAVVQAIFFLFAWLGVRLRKNSLRTLVGARWSSWGQFARDIGLAMIFWVVWYATLSFLKLGLAAAGISNAASTGILYPKGALEVALWIPNCVLAGIVEEAVFRGYLMKQFTAWFRSVALGIVLQAILFGVAHAYTLGIRQVIIISASGMLIGVFVRWCKSIRPAMAFHAWADVFGAVIVKGLPFQ